MRKFFRRLRYQIYRARELIHGKRGGRWTTHRARAIFVSSMPRTIQPELLDTLPPQDPDAIHSRRDLRLINRFMGNHRWFQNTLPSLIQPEETALEIGAGTGELAARLRSHGTQVDGLDLLPPPTSWPPSATWHSDDLRSFEGYHPYPVILGNLIFHHLDDAELARLGRMLRAKARLIMACEPARHKIWQCFMRALGPLLGANHVTLHDAHVSIAGGFSGDELPRALGLSESDWKISCATGWLGGYRMVAIRRA